MFCVSDAVPGCGLAEHGQGGRGAGQWAGQDTTYGVAGMGEVSMQHRL